MADARRAVRRVVVAPCAGAWIEMSMTAHERWRRVVAPCAGAWIEIELTDGLQREIAVAPCAGAWIEITPVGGGVVPPDSRPLRGGVD